jgi:hypothetical protein
VIQGFVQRLRGSAELAISMLDEFKLPEALHRGRINLRVRIRTLSSRLERAEVDQRTYDLVYECIAEASALLTYERERVVRPLSHILETLRAGWRFDDLAAAIRERSVPGLEVGPDMIGEAWNDPVPAMEWAIIGHSLDLDLLANDLLAWGWWLSPSGWFESEAVSGSLGRLRTPPTAIKWDIRRASARMDAVEARRTKAKLGVIGQWEVRTAILTVANAASERAR